MKVFRREIKQKLHFIIVIYTETVRQFWREHFPSPVKVGTVHDKLQHYLFYFRDEAYECIAGSYDIEFYLTTVH